MVINEFFDRCNNVLYVRGVDEEEEGEMQEWDTLQTMHSFLVLFHLWPVIKSVSHNVKLPTISTW